MTYVPHTERETRDMLAAVGVSRMEDLFDDVPAALRFPALELPRPSSEPEITAECASATASSAATISAATIPISPATCCWR
jgi:glycine dehydrogenase subunit 1